MPANGQIDGVLLLQQCSSVPLPWSLIPVKSYCLHCHVHTHVQNVRMYACTQARRHAGMQARRHFFTQARRHSGTQARRNARAPGTPAARRRAIRALSLGSSWHAPRALRSEDFRSCGRVDWEATDETTHCQKSPGNAEQTSTQLF